MVQRGSTAQETVDVERRWSLLPRLLILGHPCLSAGAHSTLQHFLSLLLSGANKPYGQLTLHNQRLYSMKSAPTMLCNLIGQHWLTLVTSVLAAAPFIPANR